MDKYNAAVQFFKSNAGYSYDPKTESAAQGKLRCARALASAELRAARAGVWFDWHYDTDQDSSSFRGDCDPYALWVCTAYRGGNNARNIFASLSGIDFGPDGTPWDDDYRRVVEAQLATEWVP